MQKKGQRDINPYLGCQQAAKFNTHKITCMLNAMN